MIIHIQFLGLKKRLGLSRGACRRPFFGEKNEPDGVAFFLPPGHDKLAFRSETRMIAWPNKLSA
jgi:hypothetical protein